MTEPKPVTEQWRPGLTRLPELTPARRIFRTFGHRVLIQAVVKALLRVTVEGGENIPLHGPALIVSNHLGDADLPAIISTLPQPPDALAKIELYDVPILGRLMDWYGVIWLHRGRPDKPALRAALKALEEGRIVFIAPEGRYSVTGALEEGSGGAAFLALRSNAPIVPIVVTGTENENVYGSLKRFKRGLARVKAGKMFKLQEDAGARKDALVHGTSQIMRAMAELLPEKYRGEYS